MELEVGKKYAVEYPPGIAIRLPCSREIWEVLEITEDGATVSICGEDGKIYFDAFEYDRTTIAQFAESGFISEVPPPTPTNSNDDDDEIPF